MIRPAVCHSGERSLSRIQIKHSKQLSLECEARSSMSDHFTRPHQALSWDGLKLKVRGHTGSSLSVRGGRLNS